MNVANDAKKYKIALKTITFSEIFLEIIPFHYQTYIWPTFSQMYLKRAMQKEVYVLDRNWLINAILAHNTFSILKLNANQLIATVV